MKQPFANTAFSACRPAMIATMLAAAAAVITGCSRPTSPGAKPGAGAPVPVLVAKATQQDVPIEIEAIGNVAEYSKVTVRSQVTGQLKEVNFREGQDVNKGDLLFTIDPRPFQAALGQARGNLARDKAQQENAQIQFDRATKLFASNLISQEEFDNSRAALDAQKASVSSDRAAVANAELNVEFTAIRSPIDGRTGGLMVHAGNIIKAPDDVMLTINQIHPIYVVFAVPEQYLPEIKKEMHARQLKVSVLLPNGQAPSNDGTLTFVDNGVDTTTGTIQLKATFPNDDNVLWPGQFVETALTLSVLHDAVVAPTQAVQTGQDGQFIYVVKADDTVEMRPVVTSIVHDSGTVIRSGIKAGETVVTDGQLRLAPGSKVSVKTPDQPASTDRKSD
ncbi:MAG TPA: efflux RND transporter periplasmic adaptor subunit, partial [Candidatus Angelobacter sp.]|nr:efflux RND transporter periplasmic adaptor subunit [Candidatus Angelobacter sp.]